MGRSARIVSLLSLFALLITAAPAEGADAMRPSARVQAVPADDTLPSHGPHKQRAIPRGVPDQAFLNASKEARAHGLSHAPGPGGGGSSPAPSAAVSGTLNQPGLRAVDNSAANQGTPPDSTGAIGPSHYLEFVNSKVGVYSRTDLSLVTSRDLDAFVGRTGQSVFDPQIQWDQQGDRWLYVADDIDSLGRNFLALGWSKTADPSDLVNGWCRFAVSTGSLFEDYPKLGHDNVHIVFGTNAIRSNNTFATAHVFSLPKPANGDTSCASPSLSVFGSSASPLLTADSDPVFTPVPVNTADSSAVTYVVAADSPFFVASPSQVMAWHLGGPAGAPTLTQDGNMSVAAFDFPSNAPQPGTSNVIDTLDARLTQAVAHADPNAAGGPEAVWTQHTVDSASGRSVVRWYELLPASLTVRQQGTVSSATSFVFNAAISPAANGTSAALHYNTGGATSLVDIRAQSRQGTTPLSQMEDEIVLGTSSAIDQDFSCTAPNGPPCRWGDYAGASPDPANSQLVWGSNQLNGPTTSDPAWVTRNFALTDFTATGYARPKAATPVRVSLVPAYQACTSANSSHGSPLVFGSCVPPTQASSFLTVGTPDANGAAAQSTASLRFDAVNGAPGNPPDEADVGLVASATDVRTRPSLADYTGQLQASVVLRVTDRDNGASLTDPATTTDLTYAFTVPCAATGDPAIGSTCTASTTADALAPGTVLEGKRAIWQLGQVKLLDGGADGVASTTPNTVFETEGVFVP